MPLHAKHVVNVRHGWLPGDKAFIDKYIREQITLAEEIYERQQKKLHPVTRRWLKFIETDAQARIYFTDMFGPTKDGTRPPIKNYTQLVQLVDYIISKAPSFVINEDGSEIVGVPIYLVLNELINTPDGMNAFFYDKVNIIIANILGTWQNLLITARSRSVLNTEDGWLSPKALKMFEDRDGRPFKEMYICDPELPYWGFGSWDHFFTRELRDDVRPVDPDPTTSSAHASPPFSASERMCGPTIRPG